MIIMLFTSIVGYVRILVRVAMRMLVVMMLMVTMMMVMIITSAMGYVRMVAAGSGSQIHSTAGCSNCC